MQRPPPSAWFLGPKSEQRAVLREFVDDVFTDYEHWRRNYFPGDPNLINRADLRALEPWIDQVYSRLQELLNELKRNFPLYHPRYLAHMVSEQSLPAVIGQFAAMLYNPNNATEELSPVTTDFELEVGRLVAEMLGYEPRRTWAHLTSGGTLANLEALWVARQVQFAPLALRDVCAATGIDFKIVAPNGRSRMLRTISDSALPDLLDLSPAAVEMPGVLADHVGNDRRHLAALHEHVRGTKPGRISKEKEERRELARELIGEHLATSEWNPAYAGLSRIVHRVGRKPVVFAPESAHYSIRKACDVLGYGFGKDSLRLVPVTESCRLDVAALEGMLNAQAKETDTYVAAVIGVVGTTEMGAVDPIHELIRVRDRLRRSHGRSFWIHVDAAWGGYIASLYRGHGRSGRWDLNLDEAGEDKLIGDYNTAVSGAIETPEPATISEGDVQKQTGISWCDRERTASFLALSHADSITIDPHKLGYVPYPAGLVAFRDAGVKHLVGHKASYITEAHRHDVNDIGAHILEGSKPGAAAAACWLAHKAIPLDARGHGAIVASTLLSARRLAWYLQCHEDLYFALGPSRGAHRPFTFTVLGDTDTNIVCFVARPMELASKGNTLRPVTVSVGELNELNREIYRRMAKPRGPEGVTTTPYHHTFFLSRTVLESEHYQWSSVEPHLQKLGLRGNAKREYEQQGLFVLRSTVMNPHYGLARRAAGKDYLFDFVRELHRVTRTLT